MFLRPGGSCRSAGADGSPRAFVQRHDRLAAVPDRAARRVRLALRLALGEPSPPMPGALSAPRAEPRIGEGPPSVPHYNCTKVVDWYDDLSSPYVLALDSDVCPVPVTYPVAPLNTYTFLKLRGHAQAPRRRY